MQYNISYIQYKTLLSFYKFCERYFTKFFLQAKRLLSDSKVSQYTSAQRRLISGFLYQKIKISISIEFYHFKEALNGFDKLKANCPSLQKNEIQTSTHI